MSGTAKPGAMSGFGVEVGAGRAPSETAPIHRAHARRGVRLVRIRVISLAQMAESLYPYIMVPHSTRLSAGSRQGCIVQRPAAE
jgi:hypothetical protein